MNNLDGLYGFLGVVFTSIFAFLGIIAKGVFNAKKEAETARESAIKAVANTQSVSDGFANDVLAGIERLSGRLANLERAQRQHLQWHLKNDNRKG